MACHSCNVVFHAGPAPVVDTIYDLSGTVGAAERRVRIRVECDTAGRQVTARPGPGPGPGPDPHPTQWSSPTGLVPVCSAWIDGAAEVVVNETMTDPLGQIRMIVNAACVVEFRLIQWDEVAADGYATVYGPAVPPAAWINLGLDPPVSGEQMIGLKHHHGGGAGYPFFTTRTDTEAIWAWPGHGSGGVNVVGRCDLLLAMTDTGVIERLGEGWATHRADLACHWPITDDRADPANPIHPMGAAPVGAPVALDLSPVVGSGRRNALLRIYANPAGAGNFVRLRFAPSDDPGAAAYSFPTATGIMVNEHALGVSMCVAYRGVAFQRVSYAWIETGPAGIVLWSSVAGEDVEIEVVCHEVVSAAVPPVITGTGPVGGAVSPGAPITFTTTDDVQVIEGSLRLRIRHGGAGPWTTAMVGGIWQGPFGGTKTPNAGNGFDVACTTHPPMAVGLWEAEAYCEDGGGLSDTDTWSWTVAANPPTCQRKWPGSGDLVTQDPIIGFGLEDAWGITLASVNLTLRCLDDERLLIVAGAVNADEYKAQILANGANGYDCQGRLVRGLDDRHWTLELTATNVVGVPLP